jgi:TRAP-type C4-dicarboxylate transport system permease small subunit
MYIFQVSIGDYFRIGNRSVGDVYPTFGSLFSNILFNVYTFAAIILLGLLIFGGFNFIIGAGNQESGQMDKAKKAITSALAGFGIIFASYFIIQLIEAVTGAKILDPNF